jgi:hypothetical protein
MAAFHLIIYGRFWVITEVAASTSTCWICLFRCFEIGVRITLSAELFSALHRPQ